MVTKKKKRQMAGGAGNKKLKTVRSTQRMNRARRSRQRERTGKLRRTKIVSTGL